MTPEAFSRMVTLFTDDSARQLDALADDLVLLGEDPEDRHVLERAHRTVHTVKGSAAMLALRTGDENLAMRLEAVSNLARAAEERFAAALDGTYPLTEAALDVLGEVPVLLKPMLQETDAGRAATWREGFEALQRRISERNVPREIPREAALELPTQEELRAIFEADASLRAKPFPTGEDEQLTRWLGERVPLEQEGVAAPPDKEMLDQLEHEITSFSPGLGETPEAHVPHAGEVSLEAYRGETLPPPARSSEPSGSPELERELEEAARLLDEDVVPPALSSLERGRKNAPSPPKKGDASEETSPTEEEGKAVLDALAEILGVAQEREQPPDKAREDRAEETSGEVAPRAEGDERDLADLLELEREEREPAERGSVPESRVAPTPPAEPEEEPTTTLAAPSAEVPPVPTIEAEQELREEEQSLADLLGLDVDEEHQGPTGTDGSVAREPSDEEARAPSAEPERTVAAEVRRAAPSAPTEPTAEEEDPMRVIFLEEAQHLLDELNQELVAFERSPGDSETLRRILRAAHTLKGSAATVGYERISTVAHRMEDLLQIARDRGIELNADAIDVLLSATDRIDELTKEIAQHGQDRGEIDEIVARLESVGHRAAAPTRQEPASEAGLESVSGVPKEVGTAEAETLREVFVQEARELLDVLGRDLVTLEQQPEDAEVVHRAMRTAHTLKGSAAMLEYEGIRTLAHAMEDALQVIRDAQLRVSSDAVDLMLSAVDTLDAQVKAIALTGQESHEGDTEGLGRRLRRLASELSGSAKPEQGRAPVVVEEVAPPERELGETFLEEAHTRHTSLTQALVVLEHNSADEEARAQFADAALALTGSAAALGFQQVAAVAGHMEAIVQTAKEQNVPLDPEALDALGEGMELLGALLVTLRDERHDRAPDITPVLARLKEVRVGGESVTVEMAPTVPSETRHAPAVEPEPVENRRTARRIVEVDLDRLNRLMNLAAELLISRTRLSAELLHLSSVVDTLSEQGHNLTDVERRLAEMRGNGGDQRMRDEGVLKGFTEGEFDRFSEVDVLIRDLRDSSSFVNDLSAEFTGMASSFEQNIRRISTIAKDLHDEILRVRMVRVERAFTRIPRIIRDAARNEGKQINLILEGADTEIDKNILEAMNNPLLHLLRNAVGHGIEPPEERQARGKPAAGRVTVRAAQDGNRVVIEVSNDGRGIDPSTIRRAAVDRGLLNEQQANALSDTEIVDLIFEPGFSTAEKVSELSGRGVGLDVVRSVVNRFNGTVSVESTAERGTTFRIALPVTLAIGQALLVEVTGRQFALPLPSVNRIEQVAREEIVVIKDHPYLYREGVPVPLISLGGALGIPGTSPLEGTSHPVVIVREGERQTALVVDRIVGREDIVIKTLGSHLRRVPGISGATILGDGSVVMILNVPYFLSAISTAQRRTSVAPPGGHGSAPPAVALPPPTQQAQTKRAKPREASHAEKPPAPRIEQFKPRILVVDDSISIRKYVSGVLERGGYEAVTANDGVDAWEKLQDRDCRLVISDLEMPRMHGYELIAEIRKHPNTRQIPVVFLTARAGEKHRRMGKGLGAAAFLNKPFSEADLLKLVEGLVS